MHTAFLWRLGAKNKITFQIMSKDELHSLCDWHMEYLLILDIGTNESGILDLCVHDSRGKRFFVKSLRMLEESIGLSPVMENVIRWKIPAVCLHKKGFREPRSCLRGVYRWDFMTAKGGGQITCSLTEVKWKVTVTVHTCAGNTELSSCFSNHREAKLRLFSGHCKSQTSPCNQESLTACWEKPVPKM